MCARRWPRHAGTLARRWCVHTRGAPAHFPSLYKQVIKAVLKDPQDATRLSLLYANVSPDDILLRGELDALAAAHPNRFRVWYTGARCRALPRPRLMPHLLPSWPRWALPCGGLPAPREHPVLSRPLGRPPAHPCHLQWTRRARAPGPSPPASSTRPWCGSTCSPVSGGACRRHAVQCAPLWPSRPSAACTAPPALWRCARCVLMPAARAPPLPPRSRRRHHRLPVRPAANDQVRVSAGEALAPLLAEGCLSEPCCCAQPMCLPARLPPHRTWRGWATSRSSASSSEPDHSPHRPF